MGVSQKQFAVRLHSATLALLLPMIGLASAQNTSPNPPIASAPSPTPAAVAIAPVAMPIPVAQPENSLPVTPIPMPAAPATAVPAVPAGGSTDMIFSVPSAPTPEPASPSPTSISSAVTSPTTSKPASAAFSPDSSSADTSNTAQSGHVGQYETSPFRDDWLFSQDQKNRQEAKGYTLTSNVSTSSPDPGTGNTDQKLQTEYQRFLGNWGSLNIQSNFLQPETFGTDTTAQSMQQEQRATATENPGENWSWTEEVHHTELSSNDITSGSQTFGGGMSASANHQTPLNTDWKIDSQIDFSQAPVTGNQQTGQMGLELRQPLFNAPVAAIFTGKYTDTKDPSDHDFLQSQAPALEQALEWTAQSDTKMQFGFREREYANLESLTAQKSQGVFAHLTHSLLPDITFSSDLEYLRSRQDTLLEETPSGGSPTSLAGSVSAPLETVTSFQDRSMLLKFGPSFKLQQDISASLEFSNKWDTFNSGNTSSEQRISMSFKGTF